uniref:MC4 n=1 Tax=Micrococcus sp. 28 TaxID=161213 RepID=Q8VPR5_9MICC|nr:MC4 [Micrococcus sp. 28]
MSYLGSGGVGSPSRGAAAAPRTPAPGARPWTPTPRPALRCAPGRTGLHTCSSRPPRRGPPGRHQHHGTPATDHPEDEAQDQQGREFSRSAEDDPSGAAGARSTGARNAHRHTVRTKYRGRYLSEWRGISADQTCPTCLGCVMIEGTGRPSPGTHNTKRNGP